MRPLDNDEVKALALSLLKTKTNRDKQRKIGPSGIGNPCDYCLACSLKGGQYDGENPWWLGARLGTAVHAYLEHEVAKHVDEPQSYEFTALAGAVAEQRLYITHLPGYGDIHGNADLSLVSGNLIDWKTSKKDKIKQYKLDGVPFSYIVQQMLYAYGWNQQHPGTIKVCSLVFIARDGTGDQDVWVYSFEYDQGVVDEALKRLRETWEYLQNGGDIDMLESHPECFRCSRVLNRW